MPYTTTWMGRGVIWSYSGILSGAELLESNVEIYGDRRFNDLECQIVDLRGVTDFRVLKHHMKTIADLDVAAAKQNPNIRVAVVTREPTGDAMNRTYDEQSASDHWETRVFKDLASAKAWATGGQSSNESCA